MQHATMKHACPYKGLPTDRRRSFRKVERGKCWQLSHRATASIHDRMKVQEVSQQERKVRHDWNLCRDTTGTNMASIRCMLSRDAGPILRPSFRTQKETLRTLKSLTSPLLTST